MGPGQDLDAVGVPVEVPFPHLAAIEAAFEQAVPGGAVLDPEGCADRSVEAYTEGNIAHFSGPKPSLHVAAHEAAHVLHHSGASGDLGLGAEEHAELVASVTVQGGDVAPLLSGEGARVSGDVHDYTPIPVASQGPASALQWQSPGGNPLMVSDDGNLALDNQGYGRSQTAWAPAGQIAASNAILAANGSRARLRAGSSTLSGKAPDSGAARTLTQIEYVDNDSWFVNHLTDDCGTAAHEVMGVGDAPISAAQINDGAGGTTHLDPHRYVAGGGAPDQTAAETSFEELMAREWPALDRQGRYAAWAALSQQDRDTFERKWGVGRHAVPRVGQGITIASLFDTPGWTQQPNQAMTWNFHYATNIVTSGHDYLTLENYAGHGPANWFFWMSGPASKGQSFWDQHQAQQGTFNTALVVDPARHMIVDVTNLSTTDWWGDADIQVHASTATGGRGKSEERALAIGSSGSFRVRLADILPQRASEDIVITIVENDVFSHDDLLTFTWTPPFDRRGAGANALVSATARMDL